MFDKLWLNYTQWKDSGAFFEASDNKRGIQVLPQIILPTKINNNFIADV